MSDSEHGLPAAGQVANNTGGQAAKSADPGRGFADLPSCGGGGRQIGDGALARGCIGAGGGDRATVAAEDRRHPARTCRAGTGDGPVGWYDAGHRSSWQRSEERLGVRSRGSGRAAGARRDPASPPRQPTARRPRTAAPADRGAGAAVVVTARASRSVVTWSACTCSPRSPRSPCSRAGPWSSTTSPGPPTTPPRSTATSTGAGCRTCCRAWRRRSSTSASPRTPCSTGATSATTATTSKPAGSVRAPSRGSRTCSGRARPSSARSRRTRSGPRAPG